MPDPDTRRDLIATLRRLEKDPESHEEQRHRLKDWLDDPDRVGHGDHLNLSQLQNLARRREQEGRQFQLPEHLHSCRMCMELFQVVREEREQDSASSGKNRDRSAGKTVDVSDGGSRSLRIRPLVWTAAVAAMVLLAILLMRPPTFIIDSGSLQDGETTLQTGKAPTRTPLVALQPTRLSLLDGSSLLLEPGTRLRIGKTLSLQSTIDLSSGSLEIHLTSDANPFLIKTPEGELMVSAGETRSLSGEP